MSKKHVGKRVSETVIKTPPFRLDWPELLQKRKASDDPNAKDQYSVKMIFDNATTDYSLMTGELERVAKHLGGFKKINEDKQCLRKPTNAQIERYGEDVMIASANTQFDIAVVDAKRNPVTDDSAIIPGSYAVAIIEAASYDVSKSKGVKFYLKGVQLLGGGTRFATGGGVDPNEVFDEEEDLGVTTFDGDDW